MLIYRWLLDIFDRSRYPLYAESWEILSSLGEGPSHYLYCLSLKLSNPCYIYSTLGPRRSSSYPRMVKRKPNHLASRIYPSYSVPTDTGGYNVIFFFFSHAVVLWMMWIYLLLLSYHVSLSLSPHLSSSLL